MSLKIKLLDNELVPYDYLCHFITPETPAWTRHEESPDVVVGISRYGMIEVLNYTHIPKAIWLIEPTIINGDNYRVAIENQEQYDFIFTHNLEVKDKIAPGKFIYMPHGGTWLREEDINSNQEKSELVSFILSDKQWNSGHRFRHQCYEAVKDRVHGYGSGANNRIQFKASGLLPYRFSVTIENMSSIGYFTEKLIDCFLSRTIPIYHGDPTIHSVFNKEGFLQFNTVEELADILNSITPEMYQEKLLAVEENFNIALKYRFPEVLIQEFLNQQLNGSK